LTGLVFVAMSLHLSAIVSHPTHRSATRLAFHGVSVG
jgi:hypothetical protein